MTKIGKLWTAGIAYVALGVGAGLSIMYNVLETMAIRGDALGWPDIVTAVGMPGLVVLMVELYVSRLWLGAAWYVHVLRFLVVTTVGGVAMRASWTHGHAWMLAHGHTPDVAVMWPLAIDLLAILATALILSGRRRPVDMSSDTSVTSMDKIGDVMDTVATGQVMSTDTGLSAVKARLDTDYAVDMTDADTDNALPNGWVRTDTPDSGRTLRTWGDLVHDDTPDPVVTRPNGELTAWQDGYEDALSELGQEVVTEAERFLSTGHHLDIPVLSSNDDGHGHDAEDCADTLPQRTRTMSGQSVPAEFVDMVKAWISAIDGPSKADMIRLSAAHFGVSTRTIRRWLAPLTGE